MEELLAALLFQLAPAGERVLGQANPLRLRVREAEDPRAPVRGAAGVAELELLVDDDVVAAAPERPRGREAVDAGADDGDVSQSCSSAHRSPPPPARPR